MKHAPVPTRKSNPCSICGDETGKCREGSSSFVRLCMTCTLDDGLGNHSWKFKGTSKCGTWGIWYQIDERWEERNNRKSKEEEIYLRDFLRRCREAQNKPSQQPKSLFTLKPGFNDGTTADADARHRAYSAMFRDWSNFGWGLTDKHYEAICERFGYGLPIDLTRRFDSDASRASAVISKLGMASYGPIHMEHNNPKVPVPGVQPDGAGGWKFRSLNGMALALFDEQRRIIGVEVRKDRVSDEFPGRYRLLSDPEHCRWGLPEYNDEEPMPIFPDWYGNKAMAVTGRDRIAIAEGRGMKPRLCAARWEMPCIGAGGNMAATAKPLQFAHYLSINPGAEIWLLLDAGAVENKAVLGQAIRTVAFCCKRGHKVVIPWWNQRRKGLEDPDETPRCDYTRVVNDVTYHCSDTEYEDFDQQFLLGFKYVLLTPEDLGIGGGI